MSIVGQDCQVCGIEAFPTRTGGFYAEAHHVDELAHENPGNLCTDHVLVVCRMCHAKLHHAPMTVSMKDNRILLRLAGKRYKILPNSEANLEQKLGLG
jgi:predicted HNH restriction endonuclease